MTASLETFAKVRALHDRAATDGEREAAAGRMAQLARGAGMTVAEAVSKLDAPPPMTPAQAAAASFAEFFNRPEFIAERAERHAQRQARRAQILTKFGSAEAVYADTEREASLREACRPFTVPDRRPGHEEDYTLDGWKWPDSNSSIPAPVLRVVEQAWPLPSTVREAWAEYEASTNLGHMRQTMHDYEHWPDLWVMVRDHVLKTALATLPALSIGDMLARQSWIEAEIEFGVVDQTVLATLRADIERMGARLKEEGAPVQNGQMQDASDLRRGLRTNADKRREVLALLNAGNSGTAPLTDREIARRAGVSPSTVGAVRRATFTKQGNADA